jgi:hypothetical protein
MKEPQHMTREELADVVTRLQKYLYYDEGDKKWTPEFDYGSDTLDAVHTIMANAGLVPAEGAGPTNEQRIEALVEQLEEARNRKGEDVQYAVDDLIYDHCGTSKKWSNVNNQGFQGQVEALVEAVGVEETEKLVKDVAEATYP